MTQRNRPAADHRAARLSAHPNLQDSFRSCLSVPAGFFAACDPTNPDEPLLLRRGPGLRDSLRLCFEFGAKRGPVLRAQDIPEDLRGRERAAWIARWNRTHFEPWWSAVLEQVAADPPAARQRFTEYTGRCHQCGQLLREDHPGCRAVILP